MRRIRMPDERARAIKRFALQILNTSLAVIIALSFEGLVEWRRIRNLVATARAHMQSEIGDNQRDLRKAMSWYAQIDAELDHLRELSGDFLAAHRARLAGKDPEVKEGKWSLRKMTVLLSETSRTTAEATGALGHMDYAEVKLYAEVYGIQREFMRLREGMEADQARVHAAVKDDLGQLTAAELETLRALLLVQQQSLRELMGYGRLLLGFYDRTLRGARS